MDNLFSQSDRPLKNQDVVRGKLFCDGGSRGNPGKCAGGAVLFDTQNQEIDQKGLYCGIQTNNFGEYSGLILGLELALKHNITDLEVFLDAKLLVEQMSGKWKVKNKNIKPLFEKAKNLEMSFGTISFRHIKRDDNKIADGIVNKVLNNY